MFYLIKIVIEYGVMILNHPFSYAYLGTDKLEVGTRVRVSFHNSSSIGFIVEEPELINEELEVYNLGKDYALKPIEEVIDKKRIIDSTLFNLAKEVSEYYYVPFIEVLKVMLPPNLRPSGNYVNKPKKNFKTFYRLSGKDKDSYSSLERKVIEALDGKELTLSEIGNKKTLTKLVEEGIVLKEEKEVFKRVEIDEFDDEFNHELNDEQKVAYDTILSSTNKVSLLQGVTGSGKTEVYIKLVEHFLKEGKSSLILVPEIALTDRLVRLFKSHFGEEVALLHSGLTDSEKYGEYVRISNFEAKVVVGARSAIFAPIKNLGLIVIDEEHVASYKQENTPYYDARKVALMRVKNEGAKLVYGSATPSLECKARAEKGVYNLIKLLRRFNEKELPEVEIVDLKKEPIYDLRAPLISLKLKEEIEKTLAKKEQVIILLNRKGYAPNYICRKCNKVQKCPNCDIPLSFHRGEGLLKCHHCDFVADAYNYECEKCHSRDFAYVGYGTERVVEDLKLIFKDASISRLDGEISKKKGAYKKVIDAFRNREIDILVGTEMIAKGHDFPYVTLSVALLADQELGFPNYRANEETFSLLTQLIGRSGRKDREGRALIQTYSKDNETLKLVKAQDYEAFYLEEMENRRARLYPPYTYLVTITIQSDSRESVVDASYKVKNYLVEQFKDKKVNIYGPSKPYLERVNNRFYRKIMLKYKSRQDVENGLKNIFLLTFDSSKIKVDVDIDPIDNF